MKLMRAALVFLAVVVSRGSATATIDIGLYDFGTGAALLDHLIVNHGLDAAYTRYTPGSFGSVSDFSVQNVWLVPSHGYPATYDGLRSNTSFQSGSAFSRVVITGSDPDDHHPLSEASSRFMLNALQWVAGGPRPGLVVLADDNAVYDWLPPSWGVPRPQATGCFDSVSVDPGQADHPVNAGLTTALLSGWGCSAHLYFAADIGGWTTLHRLGSGPQPITIARDLCVGPPGDCDGDGAADATDNCPGVANADQADGDGDGVGDACDNCAAVVNADQADRDGNGIGDACQDTDGDGLLDINDNCPTTANADQADADGDGVGDVCDSCPGHDDHQDADHDGRPDACDNCPAVANADQADRDGNGIGDACQDTDGDGVVDVADNCPTTPNADQADADRDGVGDVCDPCTDTDGDGFGNPGFPANTCPVDNCPFTRNPDQRDSDGDGIGDACFICATLGDLPLYGAVVQQTLSAKLGSSIYGNLSFGTYFYGSACVGRAALRGVHFFEYDTPGDLVAMTATGTAVRFGSTNAYTYTPNEIEGDVVTAGGAVKGISAIYDLRGVIDTTGTHPALAGCARAMADARRASAVFASRPPTQVLGDVHVGPGQSFEISGGQNDVIQVNSLRVDGGGGGKSCDRYRYSGYPGQLYVYGDSMVVNVTGRVQLGDCAYVDTSGDVVLNVVGKGPSIRVGREIGGAPAILAPDRTLVVTGAEDDDYTYVHPFVRKIVVNGITLMSDNYSLCYR